MSEQEQQAQPLITHLVELRNRLLKGIVCVLVVFLSLAYFANQIYAQLAQPLLRHLPEGASMIATSVAAPFLTPLKLTAVLAVVVSVPYLLYQTWAFVAPALYKHEKRLVYPLLISSSLLFYLGIAFAYFVVFPLAFAFLTKVVPEGVAVATDISSYLDFVLTIFLAFGVCFEVPVAIILLVWSGITTPSDLRAKRPYVIVGAFILGMVLTPPDIFSQTLLAIPMCLLFELGVIFARFYTPKADQNTPEQHETAASTPAKSDDFDPIL